MASHTETHCGNFCCNKNFQILVTSDLHQLAGDANENHNYIAFLLFFRQLIQTALSIISIAFLNKSLKTLKNFVCIESKVNF